MVKNKILGIFIISIILISNYSIILNGFLLSKTNPVEQTTTSVPSLITDLINESNEDSANSFSNTDEIQSLLGSLSPYLDPYNLSIEDISKNLGSLVSGFESPTNMTDLNLEQLLNQFQNNNLNSSGEINEQNNSITHNYPNNYEVYMSSEYASVKTSLNSFIEAFNLAQFKYVTILNQRIISNPTDEIENCINAINEVVELELNATIIDDLFLQEMRIYLENEIETGDIDAQVLWGFENRTVLSHMLFDGETNLIIFDSFLCTLTYPHVSKVIQNNPTLNGSIRDYWGDIPFSDIEKGQYIVQLWLEWWNFFLGPKGLDYFAVYLSFDVDPYIIGEGNYQAKLYVDHWTNRDETGFYADAHQSWVLQNLRLTSDKDLIYLEVPNSIYCKDKDGWYTLGTFVGSGTSSVYNTFSSHNMPLKQDNRADPAPWDENWLWLRGSIIPQILDEVKHTLTLEFKLHFLTSQPGLFEWVWPPHDYFESFTIGTSSDCSYRISPPQIEYMVDNVISPEIADVYYTSNIENNIVDPISINVRNSLLNGLITGVKLKATVDNPAILDLNVHPDHLGDVITHPGEIYEINQWNSQPLSIEEIESFWSLFQVTSKSYGSCEINIELVEWKYKVSIEPVSGRYEPADYQSIPSPAGETLEYTVLQQPFPSLINWVDENQQPISEMGMEPCDADIYQLGIEIQNVGGLPATGIRIEVRRVGSNKLIGSYSDSSSPLAAGGTNIYMLYVQEIERGTWDHYAQVIFEYDSSVTDPIFFSELIRISVDINTLPTVEIGTSTTTLGESSMCYVNVDNPSDYLDLDYKIEITPVKRIYEYPAFNEQYFIALVLDYFTVVASAVAHIYPFTPSEIVSTVFNVVLTTIFLNYHRHDAIITETSEVYDPLPISPSSLVGTQWGHQVKDYGRDWIFHWYPNHPSYIPPAGMGWSTATARYEVDVIVEDQYGNTYPVEFDNSINEFTSLNGMVDSESNVGNTHWAYSTVQTPNWNWKMFADSQFVVAYADLLNMLFWLVLYILTHLASKIPFLSFLSVLLPFLQSQFTQYAKASAFGFTLAGLFLLECSIQDPPYEEVTEPEYSSVDYNVPSEMDSAAAVKSDEASTKVLGDLAAANESYAKTQTAYVDGDQAGVELQGTATKSYLEDTERGVHDAAVSSYTMYEEIDDEDWISEENVTQIKQEVKENGVLEEFHEATDAMGLEYESEDIDQLVDMTPPEDIVDKEKQSKRRIGTLAMAGATLELITENTDETIIDANIQAGEEVSSATETEISEMDNLRQDILDILGQDTRTSDDWLLLKQKTDTLLSLSESIVARTNNEDYLEYVYSAKDALFQFENAIDVMVISTNLDGRPGETTNMEVRIQNIGEVPDEYFISFKDEIEGWDINNWIIGDFSTPISLEPGEVAYIPVEVAIPETCDMSIDYEFEVEITSTQNDWVSDSFKSLVRLHEVEVFISPLYGSIEPGQSHIVTATVTNLGNMQEEIVVSISENAPAADWIVSTLPDALNPNPSESIEVEIEFLPPRLCTSTPGIYDITFEVYSAWYPEDRKIITVQLEILDVPFYTFDSMLFPEVTEVDPGGTVLVNLELHNYGSRTDFFDITVEGLSSDWYFITPNVMIDPCNSEFLTLTIAPPLDYTATAGIHSYTLRVVSEGDPLQEAEHVGEFKITQFAAISALGSPQVVEVKALETASYSIAVQNLGNGEDTFMIEALNLPQNWYDVEEVTLDPGETSEVVFRVTPLFDSLGIMPPPGNYEFQLKITSAFDPNVVELVDLDLIILPTPMVDVTISPENEIYTILEYITGIPQLFSVVITNIGNVPDSYSIDLLPLGGLEVQLSQDSTDFLNPGEEIEIILEITAPGYVGAVVMVYVEAISDSDPSVYGSSSALLTFQAIPPISYFDASWLSDINTLELRTEETGLLFPIIENTGTIFNSITVTLEGISASWFDFLVEEGGQPVLRDTVSLILNPSVSSVLPLIINVPDLSVLPGIYPFSIKIEGMIGNIMTVKTLIGYIEVLPSHGVVIALSPTESTLEPGESEQFLLDIKNTGSVTDNYQITVEGINPSWFILEATEIELQRDEIRPLSIQVTPPRQYSTEPGIYSMEITVTCEADPSVTESAVAIIEVLPFHEVATSIQPNYLPVEPGTEVSYYLHIHNLGNVEDVFTIEVLELDSNWYVLEMDSISLLPNEMQEIRLEVLPPRNYDTAPGIYPFSLLISCVTEPTLIELIEASIEILPFYEVTVSIAPLELIIFDNEMAEFQIDITNLGNILDTIALTVQDITIGDPIIIVNGEPLGDNTIELDPGETQICTLQITPTALGTEIFTVLVESLGGTEFGVNTLLSASLTVLDDDDDLPLIDLQYMGDYTDADPGFVRVEASDPSGLLVDPSGDYYLTQTFDPQHFEFTAIDGDADRPNDELQQTVSTDITLHDDDSTPPLLSGLAIIDSLHQITIQMDIVDQSGVASVEILVDGIPVDILAQSQTDTTYTFTLDNEWSMVYGTHSVTITVWDADADRPSDSLSSFVTGTFTTTKEEMRQFVLWEIDQLTTAVQESFDDCWDGPVSQRKAAMENKLAALKDLIWPSTAGSVQTIVLDDFNDGVLNADLWYVPPGITPPLEQEGYLWIEGTTGIASQFTLDPVPVPNPNYFGIGKRYEVRLKLDHLGRHQATFQIIDPSTGIMIGFRWDDDPAGEDISFVLIGSYRPAYPTVAQAIAVDYEWHTYGFEILSETQVAFYVDDAHIATLEYPQSFVGTYALYVANLLLSPNLPDDSRFRIDWIAEVVFESPPGEYAEAYDKLLHDIKPKLTGLKTTEFEAPWGNGVFKNPWVHCEALQEMFKAECNQILSHLTILMNL